GVVARRDRAAEDRDGRLLAERAGAIGLVVLHAAVEHDEQPRELELIGELVLEGDRGPRSGAAAREDGVAEEREPRVAAPDLLLELVDALLQITEPHGIGLTIHAGGRGGRLGLRGRRRGRGRLASLAFRRPFASRRVTTRLIGLAR